MKEWLKPEKSLRELETTKQRRPGSNYCPWIRFKQKEHKALVDNWAPGGHYHGGAHFPLVVFTNNSGWRSEEAQIRRSARTSAKAKAKGAEGKRSREKHAGSGTHSHSSAAVGMDSPAISANRRPRKASRPREARR